jgi:hypothetical protein
MGGGREVREYPRRLEHAPESGNRFSEKIMLKRKS